MASSVEFTRAGITEMSAVLKPNGSEAGRRRVLIVDDNEDNAHSVATLLSLYGCTVRTWPKPCGVLDQIQQFRPDVVFMDLDFGRGPELEMVRALCGEKDRPLVAILSGWARETDRKSVMDAGCDSFIVKGDDPQMLIAVAMEGTPKRPLG
jgi:two-component system, sensor histidine kinase